MPTSPLEAALAEVVREYVDVDPSICQAHTAYIDDANDRVCVIVPEKREAAALSYREAIPKYLPLAGSGGANPADFVRVKVYQGEQPKIELLRWEPGQFFAEDVTNHRKCQSPLVLGGAQIQPEGANWVGSLGCMVQIGNSVAAITNAHVSGLNGQGKRMYQPQASGSYFSRVTRVFPIDFARNASNVVDLAVLDGKSGDGLHRITPHQTDIAGRLGKGWKDAYSGMRVIKSGRTTGVTRGKCVGIKGVSHIGYENGTARFVDLDIFRGDNGDLSSAGDSGSAVQEESSNDLASHLFAGGGGTTLGCAARNIFKALGPNSGMYQG